jgi:hypothetical protein
MLAEVQIEPPAKEFCVRFHAEGLSEVHKRTSHDDACFQSPEALIERSVRRGRASPASYFYLKRDNRMVQASDASDTRRLNHLSVSLHSVSEEAT